MAKLTAKISNQDDFGRRLLKAMEDYMADESKKIVERHTKEIATELERARSRMVTNAIISISRYTEVHYMRDVIKFEIERTDKPEPF